MYIAILLFEVIIPQGTVDNNLVSDCLAGPKVSRSLLLQKTNPLIARPLCGSPDCAWYVLSCACLGPRHSPHNHTIIFAHLTQQQKVQILMSLDLGRASNSSPSQRRTLYTCYATVVDQLMVIMPIKTLGIIAILHQQVL